MKRRKFLSVLTIGSASIFTGCASIEEPGGFGYTEVAPFVKTVFSER